MDPERPLRSVEANSLLERAPGNHKSPRSHVVLRHASQATQQANLDVQHHGKGTEERSDPVTILGLCLMFSLIFFPMLAIPFILLGLVTWKQVHFDSLQNPGPDLPIDPNLAAPTGGYYFTEVSSTKFALVSSWASTVVGSISAPFMILFSFIIARSLVRRAQEDSRSVVRKDGHKLDHEHHIREILRLRSFMKLWEFVKSILPCNRRRRATSEGMLVAVVGVMITLLFSTLVIAGDNWVHFAVQTSQYRNYEDSFVPNPNASSIDSGDPNSANFIWASGFTTISACDAFLHDANPNNFTPCSINPTPFYNLKDPMDVNLVLGNGITDTAEDIDGMDLSKALRSQLAGTSNGEQVVTVVDPVSNLSHSFLFGLDGLYSYSSDDLSTSGIGYDFVAPTYSMQTTCIDADNPCQLKNDNSTYDCSPIFSGNLSQESTSGRLRIPGWNSSFYRIDDTTGQPVEIAWEDHNPFTFNITAQVDAISEDLLGIDSSELPRPLIATDNGSVAFALTCTASVYTATYTVINGDLKNFQPELAPPRLAAIVRAPLQVGYGRYNLYQSTIMSVLDAARNGNEPLNSSMARSFSQVAIALSSGAFNYTVNNVQRQRFDRQVTSVPKSPVWFLSTVCAAYALLSIIVFAVALVLRKNPDVHDAQQRLRLWNVSEIAKQQWKQYETLGESALSDTRSVDASDEGEEHEKKGSKTKGRYKAVKYLAK